MLDPGSLDVLVNDLEEVRRRAGGILVRDLLTTEWIWDAVRRHYERKRLLLALNYTREIVTALEAHGLTGEGAAALCSAHFGEGFFSRLALWDVLACAVDLGLGITFGRESLLSEYPRVSLDSDGLLGDGPPVRRVTKDWTQMDDGRVVLHSTFFRSGVGTSGGFLDVLLSGGQVSRTVRVHPLTAVVLPAAFADDRFTRAFIRGPRGLRIEDLQDPHQPEDASGTVTEHRRVTEEPLHLLFPLERLEVMWSRRDGIKTVQIEELLPMSADSSVVGNWYVHAEWDPTSGHFRHFDGAIRYYEARRYHERLAKDVKRAGRMADDYVKLFRVDTNVSLKKWCDLVARYFEGNELVLEYLGGAADDK